MQAYKSEMDDERIAAVSFRRAIGSGSLWKPGARAASGADAGYRRCMTTPLDDARYINLLSFKKDGSGVETPVWTAPLDGKLVVFTAGDSYKVKRIRRNPTIRVARCDVRGKVLGPWLDGTCILVEDAEQQGRIMEALGRKYGLQVRLLNFFSRLSGRAKKRAYLAITLA
jgi:PPOX class probable F420-dependent enzyme